MLIPTQWGQINPGPPYAPGGGSFWTPPPIPFPVAGGNWWNWPQCYLLGNCQGVQLAPGSAPPTPPPQQNQQNQPWLNQPAMQWNLGWPLSPIKVTNQQIVQVIMVVAGLILIVVGLAVFTGKSVVGVPTFDPPARPVAKPEKVGRPLGDVRSDRPLGDAA